jgi:predicted anti-sigma-YlaC factor YlaD
MSTRPYITCRELIEFLVDYLERSLSADEQVDFDRHLSVCASCRAYLASYETTIRFEKTLNDTALDDAPEELIQAILDVLH